MPAPPSAPGAPPVPKRLMAKPRTVELLAVMKMPFAVAPALVPFSSMSGELAYPGCVVASSATGSEIVGSADSGAIV